MLKLIKRLLSMSGKPEIINSNSLLLKMLIRMLGINSWNPSKKAFNCNSISLPILA